MSSDRFLNRELSWLDFEVRVLELASDPQMPLLERVKLCSIVSSNLDEFFAVRMAGLERQVAGDVARPSPDGRTPKQTMEEARRRIRALQEAQEELWLNDLRPRLVNEGIRVLTIGECGRRELRVLAKRFDRHVAPLLTPIAIGAAARFPQVASLALNIAAITRDDVSDEPRFIHINVPEAVPWFLDVGRHGAYVPIEDAILHFLPNVIGSPIEGQAVFRITRDAQLSIAHDVDDLLEAVEDKLRERRFGAAVRMELSAGATPGLIDRLRNALGIDRGQVYESRAPLGLARLIDLTNIDRPTLKDATWVPVTRRAFADRDPSAVLARIRQRDVLVHHPYDSFESSVEAFVASARDRKVVALKATVYRTGDHSPTLSSLMETAQENKQALALVELRARFDENRNIEWARTLAQSGVDVVHGIPELKVHAKLALLIRRERGRLRRYVHVGTGNYHASNASTYEDLSLFTADEDIAADVADVFNAVTGLVRPAGFRKLLVGPWFLREGLVREIERVAAAARAGQDARIRIKVNALVDPEIVDALYAASAAGVTVEVITRGICVLRPGVPGLSERVTVRSVLGRFLEHSRIFSFQAGERVTTWIGSADLMPRNLDRRVEVLVPVEDARLRAEISAVLDALLEDTRCSWQLDSDGEWHRTRPRTGAVAVSAQDVLMAKATKRTKKRHASPAAPARKAA